MWLALISTIASICTAQTNFYKSFNVANEFEASNNTFNVRSTVDTNNDETLNISFSFINGRCWNPKLSLSFEEIDFDKVEEYFNVFYPSTSHIIANCSGKYQQNCGVFSQCINNYDFSNINFFEDGQTITIYVTKSAEVNPFCDGYSMNMNVTISCSYEQYHKWHTMRNNGLPIKIYGHIVAYYNGQLTILGGTTDTLPYSHIAYTKTITPYKNLNNATGNSLQFSSSSWKSNVGAPNNMELFCDGQCYTQILDMLYIFGAFDTNDKVHSSLHKYQLNAHGTPWINTTTYNPSSDLSKLTQVCVTNNGSNIFIIGGYDNVSTSPYHNIQMYDINNNNWKSSFATLIITRASAGCAVVNNILYIIGGYIFYPTQATNSIEMLDLNTMSSQLISEVLDNTRIGHTILADNMHRLWIIGGRSIDGYNLPNVEIFDTRNNTMISTKKPIKYASTLSDADYTGAFYDNNIMFTTGGKDERQGIITNDIQYLAVTVLGTDAYPTPPPTPHPIPTPYPTPIGHYIGANKTFDMSGHNPSETLSFTQIIQSTEDLKTEPSFFYIDFKFINGICVNASLSFSFEEVDFQTSTTEYIDVFYPIYPTDEVAHCTGSYDFNCDTWITCINRMQLEQPTLDTSDNSYNYHISVVKSANVNNFCTYAINAKVTIHCGPRPPATASPTPIPTIEPTTMAPTSFYTNVSGIFDMQLYMNDTVSFTIPVQSDRDNNRDELFVVEFHFINGLCHNPRLTFDFEEIDFASPTEFIEIYYPSYPSNLLQRCDGTSDFNCGYFINCLNSYLLTYNETNTLKLTLLKSADVGAWCDHANATLSLHANVTITCGPVTITTQPTVIPTLSPTTPIFAFDKTFDLSVMDNNKLINDYTINLHSAVDNGTDVIFNVTLKFINGICYSPYLSVIFEEIDHASDDEYLEIRYPSNQIYDVIGKCNGNDDQNCDSYEQCMAYYDLAVHNISQVSDEITIYVLKSAQVNAFCDNSINANITISCIKPEKTCPPTPICTPGPTLTTMPTPGPTIPDIKTTEKPTNKPTNIPITPTKTVRPTMVTLFPPTEKPSRDCGDASNVNGGGSDDKLMDYLPWILFGVSGFFNFLLLIALIQQCRFRKSIEMRQRMALRNDSTQMVSMQTRAGHNDFQEIVSDASVDYVTMAR